MLMLNQSIFESEFKYENNLTSPYELSNKIRNPFLPYASKSIVYLTMQESLVIENLRDNFSRSIQIEILKRIT